MTRVLAALAALLLMSCALASAQTSVPLNFWQFSAGQVLAPYDDEGPEWLVIVGPAAAYHPKFEGSNEYKIQPGAIIDARYRGRLYLSTGEGVGYDFLRGKNYRVGAGISYDPGRNDDSDRLRGLGGVDPTAQAKFYADLVFRPNIIDREVPLILSVNVRRAIGGYDGTIANIGAYMPIAGSEEQRYFVFLGASGTYWDQPTARTYFGVSPAQSAASSLPVFNAKGGPESFGVGVSSGWFITEHWFLSGDLSVKRILSDFNKSPIVEEPWQGFASIGIAYAF